MACIRLYMRPYLRCSFAAGCAALLAACSSQPGAHQSGPDAGVGILVELRSSQARAEPAVEGERQVSEDLALFAWDFAKELGSAQRNFVYSPFSVAVAGAMLSAGAEAATLSGIQAALRFRAAGAPLHEGYNALGQQLSQRSHPGGTAFNAQELRFANDFWVSEQLAPSSSFLDTLAAYYGAGVFLAPFSSQPVVARQAINARIQEQTAGLIPELLPEGSVDRTTLFVLTNSLYLRAFWTHKFRSQDTTPAPFTSLDGEVRNVDTMHRLLTVGYLEDDGFIAFSLPYERSELEMVFVVPALGQFPSTWQGFGAEQARTVLDRLESRPLDLALPKFDIESESPLRQALIERGMERAFTEHADFDPIAADAFLSGAFHRAKLAIDERGTIAAAATAVAGGAGPPLIPIPVAVDRPFLFFVRDRPTDAVLFLGHVVALP
jgi:serpin B